MAKTLEIHQRRRGGRLEGGLERERGWELSMRMGDLLTILYYNLLLFIDIFHI
jgi:hypothetical protein